MSQIRRFFSSLRSVFRMVTLADSSPAPVGAIAWALLRLEWHTTIERRRHDAVVRFRFLEYDVESFSYATLLKLFRDIFVAGEYSLALPTEFPVIVDAGANIGMATLYFKHRYPGSRIWAFEPDPRAFELLQRNVVRNGLANVTLVNAALADYDGMLPFYYDEAAPEVLIMSSNPERLPGSCRMVPCLRLSEAMPPGPVDLMKMDIEGAEGMVLAELAASGRLGDIDRLVLEYHHGIGSEPSRLGGFLTLLEESGFVYSVQANFVLPGCFQDLLIAALRPSSRNTVSR
jgi:FkbM family methyltransferase